MLEGISTFCFVASYTVALALELVQLARPGKVPRIVGLIFGVAGLLAQTLFLADKAPSLSTHFGSLLVLAWVLAVFYLYGAVHHRQLAWGVFVLPVVLGLIGLAYLDQNSFTRGSWLSFVEELRGDGFWSIVHGAVLLLAAVGVCVGFVASVMYLIQARRLKAKVMPGKGIRLLSLERLEQMIRRAITWSFPLLTVGVLVGVILMIQRAPELRGWTDQRIIGTAILWVVFALLMYLRYGYHLRGRQLALLTIVTFALFVATLTSSHQFLR
ncbi:MAG: cytochrome c biogenesis protein CcsA [Gemmataceae bacterium]